MTLTRQLEQRRLLCLPQRVDLTATDYDARSPLHVAVSSSRAGVVAFLLRRVGPVGFALQDRWGHTPLDCARMEIAHWRDSSAATTATPSTAQPARSVGQAQPADPPTGGGGVARASSWAVVNADKERDARTVLSLLEAFAAALSASAGRGGGGGLLPTSPPTLVFD